MELERQPDGQAVAEQGKGPELESPEPIGNPAY